jgi:hypothetical protein
VVGLKGVGTGWAEDVAPADSDPEMIVAALL